MSLILMFLLKCVLFVIVTWEERVNCLPPRNLRNQFRDPKLNHTFQTIFLIFCLTFGEKNILNQIPTPDKTNCVRVFDCGGGESL